MRVSPCRRSRIYAHMTLVRLGSPVRFLQPVRCGSLTVESNLPVYPFDRLFPTSLENSCGHTVSSHQVCFDGRSITSLETKGSSPLLASPGVQPIQASPCVQDLRNCIVHTFQPFRFTAMLLSPLSFDARWGSCPKRLLRSQPSAPMEQSYERQSGAQGSQRGTISL